jgi:hypothetical protein
MDESGTHLPFALLADIAEQRANPDDAALVHLAACRKCADELDWLTQTLVLLRARELEEPPARAVELSRALFRRRAARPAPRRPLLAALGFDSARSAPAFGLRSGATAERQLIFHAASYSIDLRVRPIEDRWVVAGQLLGDEAVAGLPGGRAEILGPADAASVEIDELSEFELPPLRPGQYTLSLLLGELILVIPALELGR